MRWLLAAIRSAAPGAADPAPDRAQPALRDIQGPVDISPFTALQMALAAAVLLALVGLAVWLFLRYRPARPVTPPPTPREVARAALARLRAQMAGLTPYEFSIEVSGVLRTFVENEYHLRALEQTSPEFLESIAALPRFSPAEKGLLADFLERCDMIKFARVEADLAVSEQLLASASAFVEEARR